MGGTAFAVLGLSTPRMPLQVYQQALKQTCTIIQRHYKFVGSPIEAPEKIDYGDLDFMVCEPLQREFDSTLVPLATVAENISQALNAEKKIVTNGGLNFAVSYPEEVNAYIQVDVHLLSSKESFDWKMWQESHGDLWSIIGAIIRPFGITVNDAGMYLRIPEIEALDKKKARVLLTREPAKVLEFLGLDMTTWSRPFTSQEEMFEYAAGCRLFYVKETKEENQEEGDSIVVGTGGIDQMLKHADKAKIKKRSVFRAFMEEFIPACREEGRFGNNDVTRESVRDSAFKMFDVQEQYEKQRKEFLVAKNHGDLWTLAIKVGVPLEIDGMLRSAACKKFRKVFQENEPFVDGIVLPQADADGLRDIDEVKAFVAENWKYAVKG